MRAFLTPVLPGSALAALLAGGAIAQSTAPAPRLAPAPASLLPATQALFDSYVATGKTPGVVGAGGGGDRPTVFVSAGRVAREDDARRAGPDSLWRVYSMTKPITAMAAMILIDQGKMRLDEPLGDILPAFKNMRVLDNPDGPVDATHPAKTPITIRNLLTHTAGLGYDLGQPVAAKGALIERYMALGINPAQLSQGTESTFRKTRPSSLQAFADKLATLPLIAEPGTKWSYSIGLDLMGAVIEKVSGMPFDTFVNTRIFKPLKMRTSYWTVPKSEVGRFAPNYAFGPGGVMIAFDPAAPSVYLSPPSFPYGGAGLAMSTLLPPGGECGELPGKTGGTMAPRMGFGAGGAVILEDKADSVGAGTYGWGGAAGTIAWVNPVKKLRGTVMVNYFPGEKWPLRADPVKALRADMARYARR